jgi:hypothetical protein
MITKRQLTAFHEAGHAVVTLRLGYKVETVTIKRDKGNLGSAAITKHGGLTSDHIRIDLAGMIAESIIDPDTSFKDRCKQGGLTDWRRAREIARLLATFYDTKPDIVIEEHFAWLAGRGLGRCLIGTLSCCSLPPLFCSLLLSPGLSSC